jgi:hypothetical protein
MIFFRLKNDFAICYYTIKIMNLKTTPDELETLINDMKATYQFKDMNILEHGQSVAEEYERVVEDNGKRIRF